MCHFHYSFLKPLVLLCKINTFATRWYLTDDPPSQNHYLYKVKPTLLPTEPPPRTITFMRQNQQFCYLMVPQRGSPFIKLSLLHRKTYTFADRGLAPFSVEFVGFEQTLSKFVSYMRVFYIWAFALILFCCAGF